MLMKLITNKSVEGGGYVKNIISLAVIKKLKYKVITQITARGFRVNGFWLKHYGIGFVG